MTSLDTAKAILAKASLFDARIPQADINIARAWAEAIGDIDMRDALTAVVQHYNVAGADRIVPGDVTERVRKIRADRLTHYGRNEPEYDGHDVAGGLEAIREHNRRVAAGEIVEPPRQLSNGPRSEDVDRLLKDALRGIPTAEERTA